MSSFWKDILFITAFVFFFLLLYRPFFLGKISTTEINYPLHILGYTFNTFAAAWINYALMRQFFRTAMSNWNLLREISWNLWNFFTIGIANYLFAVISGVFPSGLDSLFQILWITFLVGVIPVTLRMFIRVWASAQKEEESTPVIEKEEDQHSSPPVLSPELLTLEFPGRKLLVNPDAFLAARSIRNDLVMWIRKQEGEVQTIIVRGSLKALVDQVADQPFIKQCHRSFVVNTNRVADGHVTTAGGVLRLDPINKEIPVSRSFASEIGSIVTRQMNSYL